MLRQELQADCVAEACERQGIPGARLEERWGKRVAGPEPRQELRPPQEQRGSNTDVWSLLCHLLAVWLQAGSLTSLSLSYCSWK